MKNDKAMAWAIAADYETGRRFMGIYNFTHAAPSACGLRTAMFFTRREAESASKKLGDWPRGRRVVRVNIKIQTVAKAQRTEAA